MKTTVIPAQITTVEDRIASSLGLSQLLLLTLPVFSGSLFYVILPPSMHSTPYKIVVILLILLICDLMAIRVKGKILLLWLVLIARYNNRPRYYVFNKNTLISREPFVSEPKPTTFKKTKTQRKKIQLPQLSIKEIALVHDTLANKTQSVEFKVNKQGGLRVLITEGKE